MVDNTWAYEIKSKVLGILDAYAIPKLQKKFPKMKFTQGLTITNLKSRLSKPTFPTIYVEEISFYESERDLEGKEINTVNVAYQVKSITNTSQSDSEMILAIVSDVFKFMMFEIIGTPSVPSAENGVFTNTSRFARAIGKNDRLI